MRHPDWIILGGGIAGLSAAYFLATRGARVHLLEREPFFAVHASGRNAAIFRSADLSPMGCELALRSREILDARMPEPWLRKTGAIYAAADPSPLAPLARLPIRSRPLALAELVTKLPLLAGGRLRAGLEVPDDGVIDTHGVISWLADAARKAGATLQTGAEVATLLPDGVRLTDGTRLEGGGLVLAAGAWAAALGATRDTPLPLTPMRRHLVLLDAETATDADAPVLWALDDEVYFRPESGGLLSCPCDETPAPPGIPVEDPEALERLAEKLERTAPPLALGAVRRRWACLRTFAPDRALVIGVDPRARNLHWLTGLGGHGMTAGVAAGELLADAIETGRGPEALAPARLL